MCNIDDYIKQSVDMENISAGGSVAYSFGDVVLIKYLGYPGYDIPREDAEILARKVNEKHEKGVRTPKHLAIKRVKDNEESICWVLQEKAKGENFTKYCSSEDINTCLDIQSRLLNAPDKHYENFLNDICELYNLGIELIPRNIFYDEDRENGGFTIIDLFCASINPFDSNLRSDVLNVIDMARGVYLRTQLSCEKLTEEELKLSMEQFYRMSQKIIRAAEKVIPNFSKHRRWVLRTLSAGELDFLEKMVLMLVIFR